MSQKIISAVRVVLINDKSAMLLMQVHFPGIKKVDQSPHNETYWITIGGKIDGDETPQETAKREVKEETGLEDVTIGPVLGHHIFFLIVNDQLTRYEHTYVIAFTKTKNLSNRLWSEKEKSYVKDMRWFSIEDIKNNQKDIHPVDSNLAAIYFPQFLRGEIPSEPLQF